MRERNARPKREHLNLLPAKESGDLLRVRTCRLCFGITTNETMNTPTPIRDIPTLFTITYSDGYATKLVDAAEYDRVFSELTAAREELDKWEQIAHDKLSEVCRQIEKTRVVTEQRDKLAAGLEVAQQVGIQLGEQRDRLADALQSIKNYWIADEALQSLNPDHTVDANDMIPAVKGGADE